MACDFRSRASPRSADGDSNAWRILCYYRRRLLAMPPTVAHLVGFDTNSIVYATYDMGAALCGCHFADDDQRWR